MHSEVFDNISLHDQQLFDNQLVDHVGPHLLVGEKSIFVRGTEPITRKRTFVSAQNTTGKIWGIGLSVIYFRKLRLAIDRFLSDSGYSAGHWTRTQAGGCLLGRGYIYNNTNYYNNSVTAPRYFTYSSR